MCASLKSDVEKNDPAAATPPEFYCDLCDGEVTHNGCSIQYGELSGCHEPSEAIEGNLLESKEFAQTVMSYDLEGYMTSQERKCHQSLRIILDSGASGHMLPCPSLFCKGSMRTVQGRVSLGKSEYKLPIVGQGNTPICILDEVLYVPDLSFGLISLSKFDKKGYKIQLGNGEVTVLDDDGRPVLSGTLEGSLYYLDKSYMAMLKSGDCCQCETACLCCGTGSADMDVVEEDVEEIFSQGVIAAAAARNDEESLILGGSAPGKLSSTVVGLEPLELLHKRLGHLGAANIKKALKHKMYVGAKYSYDDIKDSELKFCPVCMEGRMKAFSSRKDFRTKKFGLFQKIGMDYKGKFSVTSVNGYTGFYLIADYGSNYVFAYPVKSKDEESTLNVLEKFKSAVGQAKRTIEIFQSDSEAVLLGEGVSKWLLDNEIRVQASAPRVHWQNGFIESNIGKVMDKTRTLLADGRVPNKYWVHALLCACYLINRHPFGDSDKTPYEVRFGEPPDISHFVPFYSPGVYHLTKEERRGPLDYKARRCRMLGYSDKSKNSYLVLDVSSGAIRTRHDCVFDETMFEFIGQNNLNGELETDDVEPLEIESDSDESVDEANTDDNQEEFPYWQPEAANNVLLERWIDDVNEHYLACTAKASGVTELQKLPIVSSIAGALNGPDGHLWRAALDKEWKAFVDRNVFGPAPQVGRAMKTKLIFKAMYDNDYSIKFKARLVACGYSQIKGVDYEETYAPTVSTVVTFIAIQVGAMYGMEFSSFDVTAAFLEGKNDFQNFARLPKELGGLRVEVIGNFYGEKQGPKIWNDMMNDILLSYGFTRCPVQPCLYRYFDENGFIYVVVHVDDGLMIFNCKIYRDKFMEYFATRVQKVTKKDAVQKYVGMDFEFNPTEMTVTLSHQLFISQNYSDYSPKYGTPMAADTNLRAAEPNVNNSSLLSAIGKLRFICERGRPDLLVVTGELATGGDKHPSDEHLKTLERVKHFMTRTITAGLKLGGLGSLKVFGYSDAAYITDGNCKSRLGGCVFMNTDSGSVRSFSVNDTQPSSLSHSSTEAEIKAMDYWIREVIHIMDICGFLCGNYDEPVQLFVDNLSAIELCESLKQSHRVKHINLRIHFIREMVESRFVQLNFVPTDFNVADVLTKPLAEEKYSRFCKILMEGHSGIFPENFDAKKELN